MPSYRDVPPSRKVLKNCTHIDAPFRGVKIVGFEGSLPAKVLDLVDDLRAAVVTLARVAFRVSETQSSSLGRSFLKRFLILDYSSFLLPWQPCLSLKTFLKEKLLGPWFQVVSMLAFYSDDPSLKPAEVYSFYSVN